MKRLFFSMSLSVACLASGAVFLTSALVSRSETRQLEVRDAHVRIVATTPKKDGNVYSAYVVPDLSKVDLTQYYRDLYGLCGEHRSLALEIGWPKEEWDTLSQIMWRESKCQSMAWSGSDAGLMQINKVHTEWAAMMGWKWPDDLFVAENNLTFAYRLWVESGWKPWRFSGEIPSQN